MLAVLNGHRAVGRTERNSVDCDARDLGVAGRFDGDIFRCLVAVCRHGWRAVAHKYDERGRRFSFGRLGY